MARPDQRRASARPEDPLGDTNTDPRLDTRVVPERTSYGASEGARQLARSLGRVDRTVQAQTARIVREENQRERNRLQAEATRTALLDADDGVSIETAREREPFSDDIYQAAYMKTRYQQNARDEVEATRQHIAENAENPEFDAEQYLTDREHGLIEGVDDPEASAAMIPYVTSEFDRIRRTVQQDAIADQKQKTLTTFSAWAGDLVGKGVIEDRAGVDTVLSRAQDMNIDEEEAKSVLVSRVARQAVENGNPEALDALADRGDNDAALADDPRFSGDIADARAQAEANRQEAQAQSNFGARIALEDSAASGSLTMSRIQQNVDAGVISEAQGVSLYRRNSSARDSQTQSTNYAAMFTNGTLYQADGYATSKEVQGGIDQARVGFIRQAQDSGGTVEDGLRNWMHAYRTNGTGIASKWLSNEFAHGYSQRNSEGTPTDGLKRAAALYGMAKSMRGGDAIIAKNMTDDQIAFYERYQRNRETHGDERAFAMTVEQGGNGGNLAGVTNTQSWRNNIDSVVRNLSSVDQSYWPTGNTEIQNPGYARREIERQARQLVADDVANADEAPGIAETQFKANHSIVKGAYVRTGNNPLPDNVDDQVDQQIDQLLPQIKEDLGEDVAPAESATGYDGRQFGDVSDAMKTPGQRQDEQIRAQLKYIPDPQHPRRLRVLYGPTGEPIHVRDQDGRRRILSIDLNRATPGQ